MSKLKKGVLIFSVLLILASAAFSEDTAQSNSGDNVFRVEGGFEMLSMPAEGKSTWSANAGKSLVISDFLVYDGTNYVSAKADGEKSPESVENKGKKAFEIELANLDPGQQIIIIAGKGIEKIGCNILGEKLIGPDLSTQKVAIERLGNVFIAQLKEYNLVLETLVELNVKKEDEYSRVRIRLKKINGKNIKDFAEEEIDFIACQFKKNNGGIDYYSGDHLKITFKAAEEKEPPTPTTTIKLTVYPDPYTKNVDETLTVKFTPKKALDKGFNVWISKNPKTALERVDKEETLTKTFSKIYTMTDKFEPNKQISTEILKEKFENLLVGKYQMVVSIEGNPYYSSTLLTLEKQVESILEALVEIDRKLVQGITG